MVGIFTPNVELGSRTSRPIPTFPLSPHRLTITSTRNVTPTSKASSNSNNTIYNTDINPLFPTERQNPRTNKTTAFSHPSSTHLISKHLPRRQLFQHRLELASQSPHPQTPQHAHHNLQHLLSSLGPTHIHHLI